MLPLGTVLPEDSACRDENTQGNGNYPVASLSLSEYPRLTRYTFPLGPYFDKYGIFDPERYDHMMLNEGHKYYPEDGTVFPLGSAHVLNKNRDEEGALVIIRGPLIDNISGYPEARNSANEEDFVDVEKNVPQELKNPNCGDIENEGNERIKFLKVSVEELAKFDMDEAVARGSDQQAREMGRAKFINDENDDPAQKFRDDPVITWFLDNFIMILFFSADFYEEGCSFRLHSPACSFVTWEGDISSQPEFSHLDAAQKSDFPSVFKCQKQAEDRIWNLYPVYPKQEENPIVLKLYNTYLRVNFPLPKSLLVTSKVVSDFELEANQQAGIAGFGENSYAVIDSIPTEKAAFSCGALDGGCTSVFAGGIIASLANVTKINSIKLIDHSPKLTNR